MVPLSWRLGSKRVYGHWPDDTETCWIWRYRWVAQPVSHVIYWAIRLPGDDSVWRGKSFQTQEYTILPTVSQITFYIPAHCLDAYDLLLSRYQLAQWYRINPGMRLWFKWPGIRSRRYSAHLVKWSNPCLLLNISRQRYTNLNGNRHENPSLKNDEARDIRPRAQSGCLISNTPPVNSSQGWNSCLTTHCSLNLAWRDHSALARFWLPQSLATLHNSFIDSDKG